MWKTEGPWLRDEEGRTLIPRGVNLGGSSKLPAGVESTAEKSGFYDWPSVSFVGRPFPLDEADGHFSRLASWGLRMVRLVFTWEAVEHEGPGIYDEAYLSSLAALCEKAGVHGLDIWLDPHQDAWSRWTGGDGAPAWTLTELGFRLETLHASGAARLHQEEGPSYPPMHWASNYNRLACATMFSLFFGGEDYAPGLALRGRGVQDFLQGSYLRMLQRVARAVAGISAVKAMGTMNEPSLGFIGLSDISRLQRWMLRRGPMPSPLEAMAAGEGHPMRVGDWSLGLGGNRRVGTTQLGKAGLRAWEEGRSCPWKALGLWDDAGGKPRALKPGHFTCPGDPAESYLKPFLLKAIMAIREVIPGLPVFIEGPPNAQPPRWKAGDPPSVVNASHWYDGLSLMTGSWQELLSVDGRTFRPAFGPAGIRRSFARQVGWWAKGGSAAPDAEGIRLPALIGEFGLPFDLKGGASFRTGDYTAQEAALDAYFDAMDANLVGATLWNYSSDNRHQGGDGWNLEDLSIYCAEDGGGRAVRGFCRPYPARTAGTPLSFRFDSRKGRLLYEYLADPAIGAPTEILLPAEAFPAGSFEAEACFADRASQAGAGGREGIILEEGEGILRLSQPGLSVPRRVRVQVMRKKALRA